MSLFEFTFGLSAVILGLALTHMASSVHQLLLARRRVRWAPEPILLAAIIFLVLVSVWLFQWRERDATATTIGLMILQTLKLLVVYLAAALCLPEPARDDTTDLYRHYDETRPFAFGALIAGLCLFSAYAWIRRPPVLEWALLQELVLPGLYGLLIFVRRRWVNITVLSGVLILYAWQIVGLELKA